MNENKHKSPAHPDRPLRGLVFLLGTCLILGGCLVNFPAPDNVPDDPDDPDDPVTPIPPECARYVDLAIASPGDGTSWAQALKTVKEGITAAEAAAATAEHGNCEVWVAKGIYYLYASAPTDTLQLQPKVQVYGGFAGTELGRNQRRLSENPTTLSGCINFACAQQVYHVVTGSNESTLDGFVISGGNAAGDQTNSDGGGMYLDGVAPTVSNCVFEGNKANHWGGAMYIKNAAPKIDSSAFLRNQSTSGGGAVAVYQNPAPVSFHGCQFVGNKSDLGGALITEGLASHTVISHSSFVDNMAVNNGGALHAQSGQLVVDDSLFLSNSGRQGGAFYLNNGKLTATNVLAVGNDSELAGVGILVGNSELTLRNATVAFNTAQSYGNGGVEVQPNNKAQIASSILWGNAPKNLGMSPSTTATIAYSDVQDAGFGAGAGMLQIDPWFMVSTVPKGTWETVTYNPATHQTELRAVDSFTPSALQKLILKPSQLSPKLWLPVIDNTDRVVYVLGDVSDRVLSGATYELGDFHLQTDSPCIDGADTKNAPLTDLDGEKRFDVPERPNGPGCDTSPGTACADMGAYEYHPE